MKAGLFTFLFLLLLQVAAIAQPNTGTKAPDIALPNANGEITKLSDLKGKVVLLDFWASWCRPCRQSNHALQSVYDKYKEKGFEIYGVSVDDRKNAWLNAVRQDKIKWVQVIDPNATAGSSLLQVWNVRFIPATYLIDRQGKIIASNPEKDELVKILKELL